MTDLTLPARFEDPEVLDQGSMGVVYVAKEKHLKRQVAVKVLKSEFEAGATQHARFLREIRITAQLDHPGIVPIYGFEPTTATPPAFSMKLVRGRTLRAAVDDARDRAPSDSLDALAIRLEQFVRVCDAVDFAHDKGILHRDLKPANIMIGDHGEVYVMDWGVAKALSGGRVEGAEDFDDVTGRMSPTAEVPDDGAPSDPGGTMVGSAVGTPQYMSPEQASGKATIDARSDQYALGLILHELVGLGPPVPAPTAMVALGNAMMGRTSPLKHVGGKKIPPELRAIVRKATEIDPDDRYPSVRHLGDDLRRFRRGDAVLASPDSTPQAAARWLAKHRQTALMTVFGLLLVLFGSTTFSLWAADRAEKAARAREEALASLLTAAATHAHRIDERFLEYEGLLESLVGAAVFALDGPVPRGEPLDEPELPEEPELPDTQPPAPADLAPAPAYGGFSISTIDPVFVQAPDFVADEHIGLQLRLEPLGESMRRILLKSRDRAAKMGDVAAARRMIAEQGVPIVWSFVGLEEGLHMAFPGRWGYPEGYDSRRRPWYGAAKAQHGPVWGVPYVDALGRGILLPCTMGLHDAAGEFRGVAGFDLGLRFLSDELIDLPGFADQVDAVLLDSFGRVILRSGGKVAGKIAADGALELPLFPVEEVVSAVRQGTSGWTAVGDRVVSYHRMASTGWAYVVLGDQTDLLGAR